jgi:hypothetical protein
VAVADRIDRPTSRDDSLGVDVGGGRGKTAQRVFTTRWGLLPHVGGREAAQRVAKTRWGLILARWEGNDRPARLHDRWGLLVAIAARWGRRLHCGSPMALLPLRRAGGRRTREGPKRY